jgi:hypothetical protein
VIKALQDDDVSELCNKAEPYLTFLNLDQLERQGAEIQIDVEELEEIKSIIKTAR